jgi:thiosulfate/3-mercaptopyruvate sulfurtransferase
VVGGLIFGMGFVVGGWCPGTAAVGFVSGRFDALVFFAGAIIGVFLFNGFFSELEPLYSMKSPVADYIYAVAGMSFSQSALLVTVVAVLAFWFSELVEAKFDFSLVSARGNGLWGFSVVILLLASMNLLISHPSARALLSSGPDARKVLLMAEEGLDRLAPETFAREKLSGQKRIAVVDVRSRAEYDTWHISGSVHLPLSSIIDGLQRYREFDRIVICSDGNARSGQAWVALVAAGFKNVFILDGGLSGFVDRILKPVSLREEFLSKADQEEINTWRAMFLGSGMASSAAAPVSSGALTAP